MNYFGFLIAILLIRSFSQGNIMIKKVFLTGIAKSINILTMINCLI